MNTYIHINQFKQDGGINSSKILWGAREGNGEPRKPEVTNRKPLKPPRQHPRRPPAGHREHSRASMPTLGTQGGVHGDRRPLLLGNEAQPPPCLPPTRRASGCPGPRGTSFCDDQVATSDLLPGQGLHPAGSGGRGGHLLACFVACAEKRTLSRWADNRRNTK